MRKKFKSKEAARNAIWRELERRKEARFPFPIEGRIPNFAGAREAAEILFELPKMQQAKRIKVNPDSPQRPVRKLALSREITVFMPTPRLRGGFMKLDPGKIPADRLDKASSLKHADRWASEVPLEKLPQMDLIVTGSVAVTRQGKRCGKGHGYGDLEYAILRELGYPAVPVATTVHPLQLLDDFPTDEHDLPVAFIATPEDLIEVADPPEPPRRIDWSLLTDEMIDEMPVLGELRDMQDS